MNKVIKKIFLLIAVVSLLMLFTACTESPKEELSPSDKIEGVLYNESGSNKSIADVKDVIANILDFNNREYEKIAIKYDGEEYKEVEDITYLQDILDKEAQYKISYEKGPDNETIFVVTIIGDAIVSSENTNVESGIDKLQENLINKNDIQDDISYDE